MNAWAITLRVEEDEDNDVTVLIRTTNRGDAVTQAWEAMHAYGVTVTKTINVEAVLITEGDNQ